MARYVSLSDLRALVRKAADMGPDTISGRHTNAEVNRAINYSWAAMRQLASDNGCQLFLVADAKAAGVMTVGPVAGSSFGSIAAPSKCERVYGIDVFLGANEVRRLVPASFQERNAGQLSNGPPWGFFIYNIGNSAYGGFSGITETVGRIGLVPSPDKSYAYTVWYLPCWTDLTTDDDVFDDAGLGGVDWVVWDVAARFAAADNDMAQTYGICQAERAKAEQALLKAAHGVQRSGPSSRVDIVGMDRDGRRRANDFWRGRS